MSADWAAVAERIDAFLARLERLLPPAAEAIDWKATAFRWRKHASGGFLQAVRHPHAIRFASILRRSVTDQIRRRSGLA